MRLSGAIIYTWEVFYMLNILFALDDSEKSERLIKFFKESKDIDFVDVCHDGTSASYKLSENKYQAVIIDLLLPGYDGFYLLNKYAKPVGAPKFIVISGINREEFINKAFSLGASYFMINPADPGEVMKALTELVSSSQENLIKKNRLHSLDERVSTIFINIGIPPHILGYKYLRDGVRIAVEKPSIVNQITTALYPAIALANDTTPSKVERAIRHAIEVAWNRGKMENINSLFGVKVFGPHQRPTNSEFIALVADKMLLENY